MPTPTSRLGLLKPSTSDVFSTSDLAANWQKIDDNPGVYLCTSTTRPTWGAAHKGREIMETDTLLKWIWTGSAGAGGFVRSAPTGLLKTTSGAWARAQRTTSATSSSNLYSVMLTLANVVVPPGSRTLMITATWPRVFNSTSGVSALGIFRTATANGTPRVGSWYVAGDSTSPVPGANGSGGSYVTFEPGGLAAGTYTYTFQLARYGTTGTSTVSADSTTPVELSIIEI